MPNNEQVRVPVASIGASAGGVTALQSFFEALPDRFRGDRAPGPGAWQ
jgi:chemotaxis response regulator CheB